RAFTNARTTVIRNVRFDPYPGAPGFEAITLRYAEGAASNYIQTDRVLVYDFNGIVGDNFQVYYREQGAGFIVPQTTYYGSDDNGDGIPDRVDSQGSPEAGLTNAQNWAKYGIAIAGGVAPTTATRAGIVGLVRSM
ncbi:MAG: hypothetical protein U0746_23080, partial [Gemmataceae bacterium]